MIDFPLSPTDGQLFSGTNGVLYRYSTTHTAWLSSASAPAFGGTGDFCVQNTGGAAVPTTLTTALPAIAISGNAGGWYSSSTGRFTPPAGRYFLYGQFGGSANSAMNVMAVLRKNGTSITPTALSTIAANVYSAEVNPQVIVDANGSDWFDIQIGAGATTCIIVVLVFGAFPLTGMQGPSGPAGVTQMVSTETGAMAFGTTVIPQDDTIPQITEGDQYMTLAITPKSATSKLIIEVVWNGSSSIAGAYTMLVALFQDSTANALAATYLTVPASQYASNIKFTHVMTSGTTSATTFRVRAGTSAGGATTTFNGGAAARLLGGVMASSIVISEIS